MQRHRRSTGNDLRGLPFDARQASIYVLYQAAMSALGLVRLWPVNAIYFGERLHPENLARVAHPSRRRTRHDMKRIAWRYFHRSNSKILGVMQ